MQGRGKMAKFLIEHGADIRAKNNDGREPLDLAKCETQEETIRVLTYFLSREKNPKP